MRLQALVRSLGAELHVVGDNCIDAEAAARDEADRRHVPYISPYNDEEIMAGQVWRAPQRCGHGSEECRCTGRRERWGWSCVINCL